MSEPMKPNDPAYLAKKIILESGYKPWPEGTDAYDGSNNPPKRELTARERDILVRVISDILNHVRYGYLSRTTAHIAASILLGSVPIRYGEREFLNVLVSIRDAITPRND
jgi:hypothetical protein